MKQTCFPVPLLIMASGLALAAGALPAGPPAQPLAVLIRKAPHLVYAGVNTETKVVWQLTQAESCTIEWGTSPLYQTGCARTGESDGDHRHEYTIPGLTPGSVYFYRVTAGSEQASGVFSAAPAEDAYQTRFFAYGDTRTYPATHDQVAAAIVSAYTSDPEFRSLIVSVGDLVANGDSETDWDDQFFDPSYTNIQSMLAALPYQAAIGNHEGAGLFFTKYFPYPFVGGRYWSFDYGPAHFTMVDQYTSYAAGSAQLAWIEGDLASTTKPWKFIVLHEPGWSAGGGHANNVSVQTYIQPLCEQYNVAIVFAGHNHYYARAVVNGIQHVTTGGGGAPLHVPNPAYPCVVASASAYHYCEVRIEGGVLTLVAATPSGVSVDSLSIVLPQSSVGESASGQLHGHCSLVSVGPSPSDDGATVVFSVTEKTAVRVSIYDVRGKPVSTLLDREADPGSHEIWWPGTNDSGRRVLPGVYFCRLEARGRADLAKIIIAK